MKKQSTPLQKQLGQAIKHKRLDSSMTQEELAYQSKLDRTYISGIERGMRNPSLINIGKVAKALKTKISSLFKSANN